MSTGGPSRKSFAADVMKKKSTPLINIESLQADKIHTNTYQL